MKRNLNDRGAPIPSKIFQNVNYLKPSITHMLNLEEAGDKDVDPKVKMEKFFTLLNKCVVDDAGEPMTRETFDGLLNNDFFDMIEELLELTGATKKTKKATGGKSPKGA